MLINAVIVVAVGAGAAFTPRKRADIMRRTNHDTPGAVVISYLSILQFAMHMTHGTGSISLRTCVASHKTCA